jgi:hypothetical protein
VEHEALAGGREWGSLREGVHLKDLVLHGSIILKWIFKEWEMGAWTGLIWLSMGRVGRLL